MLSSAIWIQYKNVTDRQTDRRTDTGRQQRQRLRIASRLKKSECSLAIFLLLPTELDDGSLTGAVESPSLKRGDIPWWGTGPEQLRDIYQEQLFETRKISY